MLILPREHFSWGQLFLWETDKEKYKELYFFDGERFKPNWGMKKGKEMADALISRELTGDIILDTVLEMLPEYEIKDVPFLVDYKIGKDIVKLWIQPDSYKKDLSATIEYKTAQVGENALGEKKTFWSQKMADEHGQITFYSAGIYLKTKKIPGSKLIEVETEKSDKGEKFSKLVATGEYRCFETNRSLAQILRMLARINKAVNDISKEYQEYLF